MTDLKAAPTRPLDSVLAGIQTFRSRHAAWIPVFAALAILIAMFIGAQGYFGRFFSPGLVSSLLLDNAFLLVLAVGMTFVILTGGIDLSVGSVMAFTGMVGASALNSGLPAGLAILVMLVAGGLIGLLIGVLVHYFDVQPFIASLVGMFLARGLAYLVDLRSIKIADESILWLQGNRIRLGAGWYITPTGILAIIVVILAVLILQFTRFGRTVYAIGGNENSARLMGLPVVRTKILVYVISGMCGGIAGLILIAYQGAGYPLNGMGAELDTIAAVVIGGTLLTGGTGYVLGSVIGVFVYGTIATVISFLGAEQSWKRIIVGGLLLVFVVVQRVIVTRSARRS